MIKSAVARTPILAFILMFFALGYTVAHNKVVVVPLGADAGVSGYEIVTFPSTISPSESSTSGVTLTCPVGKKVLGGGGHAGNPFVMVRSHPSGDSSWSASWRRRAGGSAGSGSVTVYAICANTIN